MRPQLVPVTPMDLDAMVEEYRLKVMMFEFVDDGSWYDAQGIAYCRSVLDLCKTGLSGPRRFAAPLLLTVWCPRSKHVLARVHAAKPYRVLVPEVTPRSAVAGTAAGRDPWLIAVDTRGVSSADPEHVQLKDRYVTVTELFVLGDWLRLQAAYAGFGDGEDEDAAPLGVELYCRCGHSPVTFHDVWDALERKSGVLRAYALR